MSPRGSALLMTLMLITIMTIVAFGLVQMGSTEVDSAAAKRRYDRSISCADAARELLMSQFRTYGASPTTLTLYQQIGDQVMASGHFDQLNIASVAAAAGYGSGGGGVADISNRIAKTGLGGTVYRFTVVCASAASVDAGSPSNQSEVEFLVRFGL